MFDSRGNKRKANDPTSKEGQELDKVIRMSEEAARIQAMSENDQIQEAINLSMQAQDAGKSSPPPTSPPSKMARVAPLFHSAKVKPPKGSDSIDWSQTLLFSPLKGKIIDRLRSSLDLVYWPAWLLPSQDTEKSRKVLMRWMLQELQWHRVVYKRPNGIVISTPRYTTTFGRDDSGAPDSAYEMPPKPFPAPLLCVKEQVEKVTGARYNSIIINYYADGKDSISYPSDDEHFLGPTPPSSPVSLSLQPTAPPLTPSKSLYEPLAISTLVTKPLPDWTSPPQFTPRAPKAPDQPLLDQRKGWCCTTAICC